MNKEDILISIIVPVYNVEKYLKKCIDSILNQTFQNFEIIFVDDGSTDNSLKILEEYKEKISKIVILHQKNQGAGSARNAGIEVAKGKYLQFLDSDDFFERTMLEELYDHAEKYNADLTVCSSKNIDENNNIISDNNPLFPINIEKIPFNIPFSWQDYPEEIFSMFAVIPWNKLYLRDLIIKNNIRFQNLTSSNDVAFSHISRICANKIVVFDKKLINYRATRTGNIGEYRANHTIDIIEALLYVKNFLKKRKLYKKLEKGLIKAFINHIRSGISLCNEKQYNKFLDEFKILMPEGLKTYNSALRKDYITPEYLDKLIGNQKVMLWGASLFIKQVLAKETKKNPNILGIVDKNSSYWGKIFENYKIFSPDAIKKLNPDAIILTVLSNNEEIYKKLKQDLAKNYKDIKLLPNIFEEKI